MNPRVQILSIRILDASMVALIILAAISSLLIWVHEAPAIDLTAAGFKFALELYQFPVWCGAAALAGLTVSLTIGALSQSSRQSAAATWALIQSNFSAYAGSGRILPIAALNSSPFSEQFNGAVSSDEMFEVQYLSPATTLRRIYNMDDLASGLEPVLNPQLVVQLDRIECHFADMKRLLSTGNPQWLFSFVDLSVTTRQLRLYLVLATGTMKSWKHAPILEQIENSPKRRMPPFENGTNACIFHGVRIELLCITDALHFSQQLESRAQQLYNIAMSVGSVWSRADERSKKVLQEISFQTLWTDSHRMYGAKIDI